MVHGNGNTIPAHRTVSSYPACFFQIFQVRNSLPLHIKPIELFVPDDPFKADREANVMEI